MNMTYMIITVEVSEFFHSISGSTTSITVAAKYVARSNATVPASDYRTIATNIHFADSFTLLFGIIQTTVIIIFDHPKGKGFRWTTNAFSRFHYS